MSNFPNLSPRVRHRRPAIVLSALAACLASVARADTFKLKSGESFEGEVLLEKPDKVWVRTFAGAKWFNRTDLADISRSPSPWQRYEVAKKSFPVTALGQFELAMWCGVNGLADEKDKHLRIAVEFDPNYEPACLALGYVKQGDRWVAPRRETLDIPRRPTGPMPAVGTGTVEKPERPVPTEKPGPAAQTKSTAREDDLDRRVRNMLSHRIGQIYSNNLTRTTAAAVGEGEQLIRAVKDPLAVDGLIDNLAHRPEMHVRRLCAEVLGNFKTDRSVLQLLVMALTDSRLEVVNQACASLRNLADPRAAAVLRKGLEGPEELLERSAATMARIDDFDGVPALIAVLVGAERTHAEHDPDVIAGYFRELAKAFSAGPIRFEPSAGLLTKDVKAQLHGGGATGRRPKPPGGEKLRTDVQVALVTLSRDKENFGFVPEAWMAWYKRVAAERSAAKVK